jgi:hypothetical protein
MQWTDAPMIHMFPPWNRNVPAGPPVELYCCSNCDTITLELNGKVIKSDLVHEKEKTALWEIPYEAGTLIAIGKKEERAGARLPRAGEKLSKAEREALVAELRREMQAAAKQLEFERAAYLRDKIKEISTTK